MNKEKVKEDLMSGKWDKYEFSALSDTLEEHELGKCIIEYLWHAPNGSEAFEQIKQIIPFSDMVSILRAYYDYEYNASYEEYDFRHLSGIFSKEEFKTFLKKFIEKDSSIDDAVQVSIFDVFSKDEVKEILLSYNSEYSHYCWNYHNPDRDGEIKPLCADAVQKIYELFSKEEIQGFLAEYISNGGGFDHNALYIIMEQSSEAERKSILLKYIEKNSFLNKEDWDYLVQCLSKQNFCSLMAKFIVLNDDGWFCENVYSIPEEYSLLLLRHLYSIQKDKRMDDCMKQLENFLPDNILKRLKRVLYEIGCKQVERLTKRVKTD